MKLNKTYRHDSEWLEINDIGEIAKKGGLYARYRLSENILVRDLVSVNSVVYNVQTLNLRWEEELFDAPNNAMEIVEDLEMRLIEKGYTIFNY